MNIDVVKIRFKNEYGDNEVSYKYLPFECCCEKLKNFEHIDFSDEYDCLNPNDYDDEDGATIPGFSICVEEPVAWEDMGELCYYRIGYCPFCGEKININVVREEDKSEKYLDLIALRKQKEELRRKTDSKKEYDELSESVRKINESINEMWGFNEYKD